MLFSFIIWSHETHNALWLWINQFSIKDWIVSPDRPPPSSYIEALTVNMTVFGDRAFKQVIKVKWGHIGETLVQQLSSFYEKRKSYQEWAVTKERPRKDTGRR